MLLRGLTRDARHWDGFGERLQAAVGATRMVMPDLAGNGLRWREASPTRVEAYVDAVRAQLSQAGLAPPYRVFALSLGAMVALSWAGRHGDELLGAVLVNTSVRSLSPLHHRLRPGAWATLLPLAFAPPASARWEQAVLRLTTRHGDADDDATRALLTRWTAWRLARPVSRANALRQLLAAARFNAPRQAPAVPLLLLASRQDRLVDSRCSARLAAAWGCPSAWHPSAGHDLPLEDADWTLAQVRRWLAEGGNVGKECTASRRVW